MNIYIYICIYNCICNIVIQYDMIGRPAAARRVRRLRGDAAGGNGGSSSSNSNSNSNSTN